MTDPYEHLRTPSAYDTMITPLLAAKEAVEANVKAVKNTAEALRLSYVRMSILDAIGDLEEAHLWDGDEPRT